MHRASHEWVYNMPTAVLYLPGLGLTIKVRQSPDWTLTSTMNMIAVVAFHVHSQTLQDLTTRNLANEYKMMSNKTELSP